MVNDRLTAITSRIEQSHVYIGYLCSLPTQYQKLKFNHVWWDTVEDLQEKQTIAQKAQKVECLPSHSEYLRCRGKHHASFSDTNLSRDPTLDDPNTNLAI